MWLARISFVNHDLNLRRKSPGGGEKARNSQIQGRDQRVGKERLGGLNISREKGSLAELSGFMKLYDFLKRIDDKQD